VLSIATVDRFFAFTPGVEAKTVKQTEDDQQAAPPYVGVVREHFDLLGDGRGKIQRKIPVPVMMIP
jgi:hypothetical protein